VLVAVVLVALLVGGLAGAGLANLADRDDDFGRRYDDHMRRDLRGPGMMGERWRERWYDRRAPDEDRWGPRRWDQQQPPWPLDPRRRPTQPPAPSPTG
jgi:hypothetical protein